MLQKLCWLCSTHRTLKGGGLFTCQFVSNEIFSVLVLCLFKKAGSNDTGRRTVGLNLTNVITYGIKQCWIILPKLETSVWRKLWPLWSHQHYVRLDSFTRLYWCFYRLSSDGLLIPKTFDALILFVSKLCVCCFRAQQMFDDVLQTLEDEPPGIRQYIYRYYAEFCYYHTPQKDLGLTYYKKVWIVQNCIQTAGVHARCIRQVQPVLANGPLRQTDIWKVELWTVNRLLTFPVLHPTGSGVMHQHITLEALCEGWPASHSALCKTNANSTSS